MDYMIFEYYRENAYCLIKFNMQTYQNLVCKTVYFEVYGLIVVKLERFKSYAGRQRLTNADINKSGIKTQL